MALQGWIIICDIHNNKKLISCTLARNRAVARLTTVFVKYGWHKSESWIQMSFAFRRSINCCNQHSNSHLQSITCGCFLFLYTTRNAGDQITCANFHTCDYTRRAVDTVFTTFCCGIYNIKQAMYEEGPAGWNCSLQHLPSATSRGC